MSQSSANMQEATREFTSLMRFRAEQFQEISMYPLGLQMVVREIIVESKQILLLADREMRGFR